MLLVACSAFVGAGARSPIQTASIGLLLCPGLGHLYVLWSLLSHSSAKVSPRGARHRRIALVVSLVGIGAVAFFVVTK